MTNKQSKSNNSKPQTDDIFADEHKDANADAGQKQLKNAAKKPQETGQEHSQQAGQETESQSDSEEPTAVKPPDKFCVPPAKPKALANNKSPTAYACA